MKYETRQLHFDAKSQTRKLRATAEGAAAELNAGALEIGALGAGAFDAGVEAVDVNAGAGAE